MNHAGSDLNRDNNSIRNEDIQNDRYSDDEDGIEQQQIAIAKSL